jgi:hypothetical protein
MSCFHHFASFYLNVEALAVCCKKQKRSRTAQGQEKTQKPRVPIREAVGEQKDLLRLVVTIYQLAQMKMAKKNLLL